MVNNAKHDAGGWTDPVEITGEDLPEEEQHVRYELTTLQYRLTDTQRANEGIQPWVRHRDARGRLLGAWRVEHGILGRTIVLRGFADEDELGDERRRARLSGKAFGAGTHLEDLDMRSFAPFPFMPPVRTGRFGDFYEIRDYHLIPGGLPATIAGWRQALPHRNQIDPITVVMAALDGPDRIVQIWPFRSLDDRIDIRRHLNESGAWPPPGGPDHIKDADSFIALPLDFSPLH